MLTPQSAALEKVTRLRERSTPPVVATLRAIRVDEIAELEASALADVVDCLLALEGFAARRLARLALETDAAAAPGVDVEVMLDLPGLMRLLNRSRSWVEHHGRDIPGRQQTTKGGRVRWVKRDVLRWVRAGNG